MNEEKFVTNNSESSLFSSFHHSLVNLVRCFFYYNKPNTYETDVSYISERDETDLRLTVTVATTTEAAKQSIFAPGEERGVTGTREAGVSSAWWYISCNFVL